MLVPHAAGAQHGLPGCQDGQISAARCPSFPAGDSSLTRPSAPLHPPPQDIELTTMNRLSTRESFKLAITKKQYWPSLLINMAV